MISIWLGLEVIPRGSKLLDCKWDVVESGPRMLAVLGESTMVGVKSKSLWLSELFPNDWPLTDDPMAAGAKEANESFDGRAEANTRDGAIGLVNEGGDDHAGNFTVKLVDPKAGSAARAFIPKSSASAGDSNALVNTPQNNSINFGFITVALIMQKRRLTYWWLKLLDRRPTAERQI